MKRAALGTVAGYALWTALWVGGGRGLARVFPEEAAAFRDGGALTATGYLACALVLSVVCSLLGGRVAASLARDRARGAVPALAALLLLTGVGVHIAYWSRLPVWYHVVFLVLIVPVTLIGGRKLEGVQ